MMLQHDDDDAPSPDVLFHFGLHMCEKCGENPRLSVTVPAVKASPNVTRARSEGNVDLTSRDYRDPPRIALNYFFDPYHMRILLKAMRFTRRFMHTPSFQSLCKTEIHPGPA